MTIDYAFTDGMRENKKKKGQVSHTHRILHSVNWSSCKGVNELGELID